MVRENMDDLDVATPLVWAFCSDNGVFFWCHFFCASEDIV